MEPTPTEDKSETPEVTVLVCSYQGANYIGTALSSLAGQTLEPAKFEILVVLNGPDEAANKATTEVVDQVRRENPELRIQRVHEPEAGYVAARNTGLELAQGKYFTILDDDDWISPNYLAAMLHHASPDTIVVANLAMVEESADDTAQPNLDNYINNLVTQHAGQQLPVAKFPEILLFDGAKLISTKLAQSYRWDPNLRIAPDTVYWSTLASNNELAVSVVAEAEGAIYYRLNRADSHSRGAELDPYDREVSARLDAYESLLEVAAKAEHNSFPAIKSSHLLLEGIGNYLLTHPADHDRTLAEVSHRNLSEIQVILLR